MIYRKGELSSASIDRDWPHQVALPASASANCGYKTIHASAKTCRFARAVIRCFTKISGLTSTVSPKRVMPRTL